MASNNTGETATTSSAKDNSAIATPNTETASAGPSSSSYANVVLSLKPTHQGIINENNKENIEDVNQSKITSTAPVTNREVNQKEQPTTQQIKDQKIEKAVSEDEDDSNFTPVVSHNRKERNSRVKRRVRDRPQGGRAGGGVNREDGNSIPASRSGGRAAAGPVSKEKDSKKRSRNKSAENANHATGDQQSSKSSSHSQGEDDEDGQDEGASKFVDAPIPTENAWKVSLILTIKLFFYNSIYCVIKYKFKCNTY